MAQINSKSHNENCWGTDGLFYGTTFGDNISGSDAPSEDEFGTIFSFNPANNTLTSLVSFDGLNGASPDSLTLGADGIFYGTTALGGSFEAGNIFSFNPANNALTILASFDVTNGALPGALTLGADGIFYGTTTFGGDSGVEGRAGFGTIFSFNPANNALTSLASFDGTNGAYPGGATFSIFGGEALTLGADGLFYGTTGLGGDSFGEIEEGFGNIFSFNPANNALTSLASFDGTNGAVPGAALTLGADGLFYGATTDDWFLVGAGEESFDDFGTIFSFNPTNNALTSLASFDGTNGAVPLAALTLGVDGSFYSTTFRGGILFEGLEELGLGTIFSFDPGNNPVQPIPEPLTLFGASAAVAFGAAFKRRKNQG